MWENGEWGMGGKGGGRVVEVGRRGRGRDCRLGLVLD